MATIPAIKIKQGGLVPGGEPTVLYVTALSLSLLRKHMSVDRWSPSNPDGYQRPLVDRRLREIAKYVQEEQGVLPTSVLVGTRPEDLPRIEPRGFEESSGGISVGQLAIPDGATLWVIDGQNREGGVNYAYERGAEGLEDYPFPVCIMWDVDRFAEMVHFNIINTRQKKMPTDIVDRHLVQMQQVQGYKMVTAGARGEKDFLRATATQIIDMLNDEPGVWHNQIAIPGVPGREKGLVRQHAMVVSIEPFLRDNWVKGVKNGDKMRVLVNFWSALKGAWPDAFDNPRDYRVQATVGIYSLHMVLPVILQRCIEVRDFSKEKMQALVEETGITSAFWHKEDGDPYTLGTGMASIRALAHYLTEQLPKADYAQVTI